jgi:predicted secreted Zn-dependent protease
MDSGSSKRGGEFELMKGLSVCLLAITIAVTAFAGADGFVGAPIDDNSSPRKINVVARPVVNETYEYYEVCGSCEEDLRCD